MTHYFLPEVPLDPSFGSLTRQMIADSVFLVTQFLVNLITFFTDITVIYKKIVITWFFSKKNKKMLVLEFFISLTENQPILSTS